MKSYCFSKGSYVERKKHMCRKKDKHYILFFSLGYLSSIMLDLGNIKLKEASIRPNNFKKGALTITFLYSVGDQEISSVT